MIFSFNGETGCIKGSRSSFRVNKLKYERLNKHSLNASENLKLRNAVIREERLAKLCLSV